jgi:dTDP-4-amino-4,6-dideoxygalactose transaminase
MNVPFVDLKAQYENIRPEIDQAINDVINSTAFIKGDYVKKFEENFARYYGVNHCIGVANGTDALFIALKMLGIGQGDEVITTALSWISTSEAISLTGAKPVFVDIEHDYFTIDTNQVEEKINANTKAIIPVHLYGQCAEMDAILNKAKKNNLYIIEDTAQAHFSEYDGKKAGTIGDVGTFSFYPGKNLGAYGDAGAIITNNEELATKMRMFSNHGALVKHQHHMEGINSRLDGIQAAILDVKLKYIKQWNERRKEIADLYSQLLRDVKDIKTPSLRHKSSHIYHVYCVRARKRDELKKFLNEKGINTAVHYPTALPNLDAYSYLNHKPSDFPVATQAENEILSLPIFPEMKREQIEFVCSEISNFYQ